MILDDRSGSRAEFVADARLKSRRCGSPLQAACNDAAAAKSARQVVNNGEILRILHKTTGDTFEWSILRTDAVFAIPSQSIKLILAVVHEPR